MINYFIHKDLQNTDHKNYRLARILVSCFLLLFLLFIPYSLYFLIKHPHDTYKNITNLVGIPFFMITLLLIKKLKNIKVVILILNLLSVFLPIASILATGGIYSVDISWLFLILICSFVFIGKKFGVISGLYLIFWISVFYYLEIQQPIDHNIFKQYVITHDSTHYLFTWIFIFIIASALLYSFINVLDKVNQKLDELSKEKIEYLQIMLNQKTKEISNLRSSLARDFHDEMGNKLAIITILSESVALKIKRNESPENITIALNNIKQCSNDLFQGTKEFIWAIDFKSDNVYEVFNYLREFGENFFNQLDISFNTNSEIENDFIGRVDTSKGRQIVYVCKEIFTNAAKHSRCTDVYYSIEIKESYFLISISDNGLGFDHNTIKKRGLSNIINRCEISGIDLKLDSALGKGTIIILKISLDQNFL